MNEREREICARFKQIRERFKCTQLVFAVILGMRRDKLKSIEYGRTPLRSDVAFAAAKLTGCNLRWLAEGEGPLKGPLPSIELIERIPPRMLFSEAWKGWLADSRDASGNLSGYATHSKSPAGGADALSYSIEEISGIFNMLPPQFHEDFYAHISKAGRCFVQQHQAMLTELSGAHNKKAKEVLTDSESDVSISPVQAQLPELLERIKKATAAPGKKTELAGFLKAPLASVSRWLSGEREPGGEIALKMDAWATLQGFPRKRPSNQK